MLGVSVGYPVRVITRPVRDFDVLRRCPNLHVGHAGEEYPVEEAIKMYHAYAQTHGITLGASRLLARALTPHADLRDEDKFENEEELTSMQETPKPETEEEGTEDNDPAPNETETEATAETDTMTTTATQSEAPRKTKAAPPRAGKVGKAKKTKGVTNGSNGGRQQPEEAKGITKITKNAKVRVERTRTVAKLPKAKSGGVTPFRAGTGKEKAFLVYKEEAKEYAQLDKAKRKAWCERLAKKLDLSPTTIASWIGGQFSSALKK